MELTIGQLIKITIGIFVVVIVVGGLYLFSSYINDFFGNLASNESVEEGAQVDNQLPKEALVGCGECGNGLSNSCDEEECKSLGNCEYSLNTVKGKFKCESIENEK